MDASVDSGEIIKEDLATQISKLETELKEVRNQLDECTQRNKLIEQLYSKTKVINEELQKEVETLTKLLDNHKKMVSLTKRNVGTQVFEDDIMAEMPQSEILRDLQREKLKSQVPIAISSELDSIAAYGDSETSDQATSDWIHITEQTAEPGEEGEIEEEAETVAESIRRAAEATLLEQSGYVYDSSSGLYYNHESGYYYDAERQLYYEPSQGIYYSYDAETQAYTEHSRVDLSQYYTQESNDSALRKRSISTESKDGMNESDKKLKSTKKRKKSQKNATKTVSYASGAKTYSKDLNSRKVTEKDLLMASLVRNGHPDAHVLKTEGLKDGRLQKEFYTESEMVVDSYGCHGDQWNSHDNDYFDEHQYEKGNNSKHFKRRRKVRKRNETHNTSANKNSTESITEHQHTPSADESENKPFIGPVIPIDLLSVKTESKSQADFCESVNDDEKSKTTEFSSSISTDQPYSADTCPIDVKPISDDNHTNSTVVPMDTRTSPSNIAVSDSAVATGDEIETHVIEQSKKDLSEHKAKSEDINQICSKESEIKEEIIQTATKDSNGTECGTIEEQCSNGQDDTTKDHPDNTAEEDDVEEGEISDSESESGEDPESKTETGEIVKKESENKELSESESESRESSSGEDEDRPIHGSQQYPPCIRMMVSASEHLQVGSLYVVTCDGATIGREDGLGHAVLIPNMNVSKMHCSLTYNEDLHAYLIKDHASVQGTFLNEQRLAKAKKLSELFRVEHGDELTIADTTFTCHIHVGSDTCRGCEPGVVQAGASQSHASEHVILSKKHKETVRRQQMKDIRKKYGLQGEQYASPQGIDNSRYSDKAAERRRTKGSDNPYQHDEAPASVHVPIAQSNLGHKLLKKMGWQEGKGLGKTSDAILEPVQAEIRSSQSAGLGSASSFSHSLDNVTDVRRTSRWLKAKERYHGNPDASYAAKPKSKPTRMTFVQGTTLVASDNHLESDDT